MIPQLLWNVFYGGCGLFGVGVSLLYFFQENLIYVPHAPGALREYEYSPNQVQLGYRDLWLETSDKKKLHGWLLWKRCFQIEAVKHRPVILFFQANAGNISHRLPFFHAMVHALDCAIVAISYRGYGPSQGSPTEAGLKLDAETALEFCRQSEFLDSSRIFVFGRSLGGAVAIDIASKNQDKIAGLILENTFTSIADMVPCLFPALKPLIRFQPVAQMLIRNKWSNKDVIQKITKTPILFLTSGKDEMVPQHQMTTLRALSRSSTIKFKEFPEGSHMGAYDEYPVEYWTAVREFILSCGKIHKE